MAQKDRLQMELNRQQELEKETKKCGTEGNEQNVSAGREKYGLLVNLRGRLIYVRICAEKLLDP